MFDTIAPETVSDADILEFMTTSQQEMFIGVIFRPGGKLYVYIGLPGVRVGGTVLVPANSYNPQPGPAKVVTLSPPAPPPTISIQRILAVLD
jgi:hypothetical protein